MPLHVAFEGIDNSGKSTLCSALAKRLGEAGIDCTISKEFTSAYGDLLKSRVAAASPREKVLAFALDRLIRLEGHAHEAPAVVLWDRYFLSAIVYRTVEGCDVQWVRDVNSVFPSPQIYLYLDVTPEESRARGRHAHKSCNYDDAFLSRCREEYRRYVADGTLHVVSGSRTTEQVEEVFAIIQQHL